jgi:hypothetical protein
MMLKLMLIATQMLVFGLAAMCLLLTYIFTNQTCVQ